MAITLVEAAKSAPDELSQAIIQIYAESSDVLRVLPFEDIMGGALSYNREESYPDVGFRGVNEGYTESTGILNPITDPLVIAGGDLDVDKFILRTRGESQRAIQEQMKLRALALRWTSAFVKGDSTTNHREFDGLQSRIQGSQIIEAADTPVDGGNALSLMKLDEAIYQVHEPTHLLMNKRMHLRLSVGARNQSVGGDLQYEKDDYGKRVTMYNGLPILVIDEDNAGNQIMPFTELASTGTTATSTSIYVMSLGDGKLTGIQNGQPMVEDLGELQDKPVMRTRVEWYSGMAVFHGKAAARVRGIKDAAVVA